MESLDAGLSKLLGSASKLLEKNSISHDEYDYLIQRLELKETYLLNLAVASTNVEILESELVKIIRSSHKPGAVLINHALPNDETSSPLGTFLHEKKKRQHAEHELKLSVATTDYDSIIESHEDS